MSKRARYILLITCILLLALSMTGLARADDSQQKKAGDISISPEDVEKVEVLYFHPRIRCISCNDIEKYAREVTKDEFAIEINVGMLVF